ncbi:MAG TPA: tetratricopeptide repeat protein [Gallionella sp.]|nr:tetratricopeptide repeat protein [Gallionella sp.]
MSLLLDARKKSLQARPAEQEPTGAEVVARTAGQNLFTAKTPRPRSGLARLDRRLLIGLGGLVLLLGGGAVYLWPAGSTPHTTPPPAGASSPPAAGPAVPPRIESVRPVAHFEEQKTPSPVEPVENPSSPAPQPRESSPSGPIRIEHPRTESIESPLKEAYQAYRNGKLDEAQQLYLAIARKDARNSDALLGLAAIAQQRGEPETEARYYAGVLALDPHNAAANAGMSALNPDDETNESRLKLLLREQGNSAALHLALGNLYAGQSRWGEAQQAYFNAYTLEPGNAEFAYNLAVSLDHLGQARPAAQYYRRALQLDPAHSTGFDHAQVSRRIDDLNH